MSSQEDSKFCCTHGKRKYFEEGRRCRKSTEHPRIFLVLAGCFSFLFIAVLCAKIVYLSSQVEKQRLQLESNQNLLNELLQWRDNNDPIKQQRAKPMSNEADEKHSGLGEILPRNITNIRHKRSASRTRRRARFPGPCHLEGRNGPNIISYLGAPRQQPRTARECILWKRTDNEPPTYCLMKTRADQDGYGVQYIKIDKTAFYYVYAQLTYESHGRLVGTGFRVERDRNGSGSTEILLRAISPPKKTGSLRRGVEESQYTGGVFRLEDGDLLAVYPLRSSSVFVMTQSRSFFGVYYVGDYDM